MDIRFANVRAQVNFLKLQYSMGEKIVPRYAFGAFALLHRRPAGTGFQVRAFLDTIKSMRGMCTRRSATIFTAVLARLMLAITRLPRRQHWSGHLLILASPPRSPLIALAV